MKGQCPEQKGGPQDKMKLKLCTQWREDTTVD